MPTPRVLEGTRDEDYNVWRFPVLNDYLQMKTTKIVNFLSNIGKPILEIWVCLEVGKSVA